jgi:Mor family transcriptional regulator
MPTRKTLRNRELKKLFDEGCVIEDLMVRYNLSRNRIRALLADEKNRRASSPDPYYRNKRDLSQV